jgi:single-stranded DNA-binding protein
VLFNFTIEGNLASQPRLSTTKSGHPVCVVRILRNSRYRNAKGEWVEGRTVSVDLVCWRDLAERVAALSKGDTIVAELSDDLYIDTSGRYPALQATARSVAVSMRWHGATSHRSNPPAQGGDPWADEVPTTGGYDTGATERPDVHQPAPGDPVAA